MPLENHTSAPSLHLVTRSDPPGARDDVMLVAGLVARAPWAEAAVWHRYMPLVYRLAFRTLGSEHAAEDLTQDVFVRLFLKVQTLRDPTALRSFIVSITLRLLKWEMRKRRVRQWVTLSPSGELPEIPAPQVDIVARRTVRRFYRLLETLRPEDRAIFALRYIEQFTLEEVAGAVGVSLATVKRRLTRIWSRVSRLVNGDPELEAFARRTEVADGA